MRDSRFSLNFTNWQCLHQCISKYNCNGIFLDGTDAPCLFAHVCHSNYDHTCSIKHVTDRKMWLLPFSTCTVSHLEVSKHLWPYRLQHSELSVSGKATKRKNVHTNETVLFICQNVTFAVLWYFDINAVLKWILNAI